MIQLAFREWQLGKLDMSTVNLKNLGIIGSKVECEKMKMESDGRWANGMPRVRGICA